ncbi:MAG: cell division protein FtsW [Chthonomonadaceae bacterium]
MRKFFARRKLADRLLYQLAIVSSVLGLLFILDSGYARSIHNQRGLLPKEFVNQLLFLAAGLVVFAIVRRIPISSWLKTSKALWFLTFVALMMVMVPGIGYEMNGAHRWLNLGLKVQPAEFAKVAVILYVAGALATRKAWPKNVPKPGSKALYLDSVVVPKLKRFLPAVWVAIAAALIALEPDLGTAAVVGVVAWVLFAVGGVSLKSMVWGTAIALVGCAGFLFAEPYRIERIVNHFHRYDARFIDDVGFQTVRSELAMASGGLFGVSPGAGAAKHVLPAATTDFASTTIGEEFGLAGWLVVAGVLAALTWRLFWLAQRSNDKFSSLVLAGAATWIGVQTITNLVMANGTLPPIGIPIPFISSGGSSLVALWALIGICQSAAVPKLAVVEEDVHESGSHRWRDRRSRVSSA